MINFYFQVLIINPLDTNIRGLLKLVESFVIHTAPIRVGLVLSTPSESSVTGLDDPAVAMLCAFNYVTQAKSAVQALAFINGVSMISQIIKPHF